MIGFELPIDQQMFHNPFISPNDTVLGFSYNNLDDNRRWKLIEANPKLNAIPEAIITLKIRGERAENFVPEKLYSSHKYYLNQKIWNVNLGKINSKLTIEDPISNDEVVSKDGSSIVKNISTSYEPQLIYSDNLNALEGEMRIQFTSSSYKFGKGFFRMRLNYYDIYNDPIFAFVSPPFRVYARKTSTDTQTLAPEKKKEGRKRKNKVNKDRSKKRRKVEQSKPKSIKISNDTEDSDKTPEISMSQFPIREENDDNDDIEGKENNLIIKSKDKCKKKKIESESNCFSEFQLKLNNLVSLQNHIKIPDQERIISESIGKLYSISPNTVESVLKNDSGFNQNLLFPITNQLSHVLGNSSQMEQFQTLNPNNNDFQFNNALVPKNLYFTNINPFNYSNVDYGMNQEANQKYGQNMSDCIIPAVKPFSICREEEIAPHLNSLFNLNNDQSNLILDNPKPFFLSEEVKNDLILSAQNLNLFSPLFPTSQCADGEYKFRFTDDLMRVKSPERISCIDTILTPSIDTPNLVIPSLSTPTIISPSEIFSKDFNFTDSKIEF